MITLEIFPLRDRRRLKTLLECLGLADSLVKIDRLSSGKPMVEYDFESSKVLIALSNIDYYKGIMDSRCSFHMIPNCKWL